MSEVATASRSEFLRVRGLRYHLRRWGDTHRPPLMLLHGWFDASASFEDLVQPLLAHWQVLAPDWRGFGCTQWQTHDHYWFQDYLGDLDALMDYCAPGVALPMLGHSMGAQIAGLYAGMRPARVSHLVLLDGPFLSEAPYEELPQRLRRWVGMLANPPQSRVYESYAQLARQVRISHPRLPEARAEFVARCWAYADGRGDIRLRADPRHRQRGPIVYRFAETEPLWRQITAPTLFIDGAESTLKRELGEAVLLQRRASIAGARSLEIAGAGHMLHFDQPEATAAAIGAFLGGAAAAMARSP